MKKTIYTHLLTIFTLLMLSASFSMAVPQMKHFLYGEATLNGEPAPVDSVITAVIDGEELGAITVAVEGLYGGPNYVDGQLEVSGSTGDRMLFYIQTPEMSNEIEADVSAHYDSGAIEELNLNFIGTIVPKSDSGSGDSGSGGSGGTGDSGSSSGGSTGTVITTTEETGEEETIVITEGETEEAAEEEREGKTKELSGESTTLILAAGDSLEFALEDEDYEIKVKAIGPNSVILIYKGEEFSIEKGEERPFDVDGDGRSDIILTLNDVDDDKISLTAAKIVKDDKSGMSAVTGASILNLKNGTIYGSVLLIILIVVGLALFFITKKRAF